VCTTSFFQADRGGLPGDAKDLDLVPGVVAAALRQLM